jgi:hypothetical protein
VAGLVSWAAYMLASAACAGMAAAAPQRATPAPLASVSASAAAARPVQGMRAPFAAVSASQQNTSRSFSKVATYRMQKVRDIASCASRT